ncbi:probable membrane-associated kinase regulator 2 [Miscanthus floridulus]|uniref:probable membrane-associated kinase regulator 2 n=1 Tax=Miscanthus floridulus TaxID=154761 RepID=UPI003458BA6E
MQILRLLAARRFRRRRRAVSTITATAATAPVTPRGGGGGCGVYVYGYGEEEDEGPFFDLDLSCCSAPASSAGSQAAESSGSESEDTTSSCAATAARGDLDFVISLQRSRSRSASPSYEERLFFRGAAPPRRPTAPGPPPLMFCASEPSDAASRARHSSASSRRGGGGRLQLRTLSFGSAKAAFYGGRASFSRSTSSARSARLFASYGGGYGSPDHQDLLRDEGKVRPPPSGDVIRRYLSKISSRLRRVAVAAPGADLRLRKSRSASSTTQVSAASAPYQSPPSARRDDSLVEKQDGIASAIAHCKESLHRASVSEVDTSLVRSRSDPGP